MEVLSSKTCAAKCIAEGEVLSRIRAGATSNFIVRAKDLFGNFKIRGGDPFGVGVMGPAQLKSLTDNGDGSCASFLLNVIRLSLFIYVMLCGANAAISHMQGDRVSKPDGDALDLSQFLKTRTLGPQILSEVPYFTSNSLLVLVTLHGKHIAGSPFSSVIEEAPKVPARRVSASVPRPVPGVPPAATAATEASTVPPPPPQRRASAAATALSSNQPAAAVTAGASTGRCGGLVMHRLRSAMLFTGVLFYSLYWMGSGTKIRSCFPLH